jgi:hypothetical protein
VVRLLLLIVLMAVEAVLVTPAMWLGLGVLAFPLMLTLLAMAVGERDMPFPRGGGSKNHQTSHEVIDYYRKSGSCADTASEQVYRLKEEDRLGQVIFGVIFYGTNAILFIEAYFRWADKAESIGLTTRWTPIAKACGQCLNFNCTVVLIPVLWDILRYVHNCKFCGFRLAKHLKLGHNVSFHKHVAGIIVGFASVHTFAHYVNWQSRPATVSPLLTSRRSALYGVCGTAHTVL